MREKLETLKGEFEKKLTVLNTCASIKTKMIIFNNNVFITKELRKEENKDRSFLEKELNKLRKKTK